MNWCGLCLSVSLVSFTNTCGGKKNSISLADRSSSWHEILYKHFVTVQKYSINIQIQHRQKKKRKKGTLIHCQFSSPRNENEVIRLWCADRISGNISGASQRKTTVKHFPEQLQNKSRPKSESLLRDFVRLKLHPRPGSRSSTHFWQDELLAQKLQWRFLLHKRCKKMSFQIIFGISGIGLRRTSCVEPFCVFFSCFLRCKAGTTGEKH